MLESCFVLPSTIWIYHFGEASPSGSLRRSRVQLLNSRGKQELVFLDEKDGTFQSELGWQGSPLDNLDHCYSWVQFLFRVYTQIPHQSSKNLVVFAIIAELLVAGPRWHIILMFFGDQGRKKSASTGWWSGLGLHSALSE